MKKIKGFTIVELVIVIAVVAILAAVMIPTFSGIIKRANISSDIQTARNMGVILTSEKPQNAYEAVAALKKHGFERLYPKTKFYSFFWIQSKNIVILTDEGVRPIFPEDMADAIFDRNDWFNLADEYNAETEAVTFPSDPPITPEPPISPEPPVDDTPTETTAPPEGTTSPPREFVSVTFTCNKPEYLAEPLVNTTVNYGSTFKFNISLAEGQYWITKLTVYQGGKQLKTDHLSPGESYSSPGIKMTDDLEINVHVVKYCIVNFEGEGIKSNGNGTFCLEVEWGIGALFKEGDMQKYFLQSGYEIESVTAATESGRIIENIYNPTTKELHLRNITENMTVTFVFKDE